MSSTRVAMLDVLRAVAVLSVMMLHTFGHGISKGGWMGQDAIWPLVSHGYLGVQLFFVISGYCIMAAALNARRGRGSMRNYLWRRVRRIYPPYWCSLVLVACLGLLTVAVNRQPWTSVFPLTLSDWGLNVILLQGPFARPDVSMVYWSLSIEVQFYLLMSVCVVAGRSMSLWLMCLSSLYLLWVLFPLISIQGTALAYWPEFACGIAAYATIHRSQFWRMTPWALWGLTAVSVIVGVMDSPSVLASDGELRTPFKQLFCFLCGAVVWAMCRPQATDTMNRGLRGMSWIGMISYSLYLTHEPIGTRVFNLTERLMRTDGLGWLFVVALALASQFLIGWLFFHVCERPWLNAPDSRAPALTVRGKEFTLLSVQTPSSS